MERARLTGFTGNLMCRFAAEQLCRSRRLVEITS